jgi:histidyl-tRNA synthetase
MVKGTRLLIGEEAKLFFATSDILRKSLVELGFQEIYLPSMWEQDTFVKKAGPEIINQMYAFRDKGDRDICLIPECTALVQQMWNEDWGKRFKQPYKVFYVQRCYRYEKPQAGRYREFTQIGVEILGNKEKASKEEAIKSLTYCLDQIKVPYKLNDAVKRGLTYYVEDGFEAEVEYLGAQKQIAGGGRYAEGIGWAIGLDRLVLALTKKEETKNG